MDLLKFPLKRRGLNCLWTVEAHDVRMYWVGMHPMVTPVVQQD